METQYPTIEMQVLGVNETIERKLKPEDKIFYTGISEILSKQCRNDLWKRLEMGLALRSYIDQGGSFEVAFCLLKHPNKSLKKINARGSRIYTKKELDFIPYSLCEDKDYGDLIKNNTNAFD